jgi:deoxyribonuclease-4
MRLFIRVGAVSERRPGAAFEVKPFKLRFIRLAHSIPEAQALVLDTPHGVVLHTGSHRGKGIEAVLPRVAEALVRIFEAAPGSALLALENAAGQGGTIGKSWGELGAIVRAVPDPRLAVCMDTCHAFAAGYNIVDAAGLDATLRELDGEVGLPRLAVMHANDSKGELGGAKDRHENIGDGFIGEAGFRLLLAEPRLRLVPMLLEVLGIDGKSGPDLENVQRLKRLRAEAQG